MFKKEKEIDTCLFGNIYTFVCYSVSVLCVNNGYFFSNWLLLKVKNS